MRVIKLWAESFESSTSGWSEKKIYLIFFVFKHVHESKYTLGYDQ